MPQSPAPKSSNLKFFVLTLRRMPSPAEIGDQQKEEAREREEDGEGHGQLS